MGHFQQGACRTSFHTTQTSWTFSSSMVIHFCKTLGGIISEEAVRRCSSKQVFLKISQILQESTCVGPLARNFIKKGLQHRCFPVKSAKFFRKYFFTEHLRWLLVICIMRHDTSRNYSQKKRRQQNKSKTYMVSVFPHIFVF